MGSTAARDRQKAGGNIVAPAPIHSSAVTVGIHSITAMAHDAAPACVTRLHLLRDDAGRAFGALVEDFLIFSLRGASAFVMRSRFAISRLSSLRN